MPERRSVFMLCNFGIDYHPPVWNAARILCESGYDVDLFSGRLSFQPFTHSRLRIHTPKGDLPIHRLMFWTKTACALVCQRPDVVHVHNYAMLSSPVTALAHGLHLPIVYQAHELHEEGVSVRAIHWARKIICPEPNRARIIKERFNLSELPVVVPNSRFPVPLQRTNILRQAFEARGGRAEILMIYQGIIAQRRHIKELILAMQDVISKVGLVIFGKTCENNPYVKRCDELVVRLGLGERVVRLPQVDLETILQYTASADVGVLFYRKTTPNNRYCAPNKLYEYMMTGLPMVGSDVEGLRPYLGDLDLGELVDSSDPASIAAGINRLVADSIRMADIRRRAQELFEQRFSYDIVGKRLVACFDEIIGENQAPGKGSA